MIRVLVVDDHEIVRAGVSGLLSAAGDIRIVGEAGSGEEALRAVRELKPDVVFMDVEMPGIGGFEATRRLASTHPQLKVIILTVHDEGPFPKHLMRAGAAGYLNKGADAEEMVRAIHAVLRGDRYIAPIIAQRIAGEIVRGQESPFDTLSEREMQVAMMVIDGSKVPDIATTLCLSPKTVRTYRQRIFEKLRVATDVELTRLGLQYGLLSRPD